MPDITNVDDLPPEVADALLRIYLSAFASGICTALILGGGAPEEQAREKARTVIGDIENDPAAVMQLMQAIGAIVEGTPDTAPAHVSIYKHRS